MKKLTNYLLQGVLYVAPLGITLYVIYTIFILMDSLLQKILIKFYDVKIPGLGIITLLLLLMLIGFLGRTFVAKPLKAVFNKAIDSVPLLKFVYSAFNDLFSAFVGKEKKFNKPVLVKVNLNSDLEKIGFVTEENLDMFDEKDKVAVYFPHSYNISGELFIVPKANIKPLHIPSSDVMKFVVSAGITGKEKKENLNS